MARTMKLYFWQSIHPDPAGGRRLDTRDACYAPSKKRVLEVSGNLGQPSALFNLRVVVDIEAELAHDPSLAEIVAAPETVFWQRSIVYGPDHSWNRVTR